MDLYLNSKSLQVSWKKLLTHYPDLGRAERDELRQEYSNAKNFYDGDIYRRLRYAALAGDLAAKGRWQSKLSATKARDVRLLEERAKKDPQTGHLQSSLDDLLPFAGLWPTVELGTFHRILSLRCPEVSTAAY